ncbi:DinB family protein [Streptomyces mashuensis]|nr:DinB family protein [Streptomyces mashuensis]
MTTTTRTSKPPTWDEPTSLATMLDYVRATAIAKCEGLSAEDARRPLLPDSPLMTPCGLIGHLRWVEAFWLEVVFLGGEDRMPWSPEDPDREMRLAQDVPLEKLVAEYEAQGARSREILAAHGLDETARSTVKVLKDGRQPALRWIVLHLIEETARHNGHLDIIRELTDGAKGM